MRPEIDWAQFVKMALAQSGKPYKYGSKWSVLDSDPKGPVDCSGFTSWCYGRFGVILPEGSEAQFHESLPAKGSDAGCLGFFKSDASVIHHCGILINNRQVIESRGEPYNKVILRPKDRWESWHEFTGWRWPKVLVPGAIKP